MIEVVLTAEVYQDFEQSGNPAWPGVGQHLVLSFNGRRLTSAGRRGNVVHLWLGKHFVNVVDQGYEASRLSVARMWKVYLEVRTDPRRIPAKHDYPVGEQYRLFDVVSYQEYSAGRDLSFEPELH